MKQTLYTIMFVTLASVFLPAADLFGQSRTYQISRPCAGTTTPAKVEVERDGDINAVPCSGRSFLVNGAAVSGSLSDGDKGDITVSGSGSTFTIDANAITTSKITNANVTLAKIANAAANSKLLGSGSAGSGSAYSEITLGSGLSMSGTTLSATAGVTAGSSLPSTCSTGEKYILDNGREFTCLDDDPDTWAEVPLAPTGGSAAGQLIRRNSANTGFENWLPTYTAAITLETPTSSENASIFFTDEAITVTKLAAVLVGSSSPSVTWTICHSTDRSATGNEVVTSGTTTTSTTTGSVVTSFNDATIPANSFIWLKTTAQSGTVASLNVTIKYTKD